MSTNPNQGQSSDQPGQYGGYRGSNPPSPSDDPYNSQWYGGQEPGSQQQNAGTYGTGQQQYGTGQQQQYSTGQQQQQTYYQPPTSTYRTSRSGDSTTASARQAAFLSNALLWVGGLFFFFKERSNSFVRFYAAQSFLFFGGVTLAYIVLRLLTLIPLIGFLLSPIVACAIWVLLIPSALIWIFLMLQSYRGVTFRIPVVSEYADGLVARFTRR